MYTHETKIHIMCIDIFWGTCIINEHSLINSATVEVSDTCTPPSVRDFMLITLNSWSQTVK